MIFYDTKGQQERAVQINELVIKNHLKDVDSDGILIGEKWKRCGLKELIWFCESLWNTDAKYGELTEKIILNHPEFKQFHTFVPFMCMMNLVRNKNNLTNALIKKFEAYIVRTIDINLSDTWDFIGVNDNTPAMIMTCIIMAGEYFGKKEWLNVGKKRLIQLQKMLERRGFISEYNSPTYTPITIYSLAAIVNYVKDSECVDIALQLEMDIWEKKCILYQESVCNTAGPFSRAYEEDRRCRTYNNRYVFYALFGDKCKVNPINTIFKENTKPNFYFQIANVWLANMEYHCPKEYVDAIFDRKFPYTVRGTAEISVSADTYLIPCLGEGDLSAENIKNQDFTELFKQDDLFEYQGGVVDLYTYMDEKYSLGTSTKEFHNGDQTDSFNIFYTKNGLAESEADIGDVFVKYVINDKISFRNDSGRKIAVQDKNSAMVLYRPRPFKKEVQTAKLAIVCDNLEYLINRAVVGNNIFTKAEMSELNFIYETNEIEPIFVDASEIYLFFYPLIANQDRQNASIELAHIENTLCISFYNYKSKNEIGKKFHNKEFCLMTNGFICEVRRKDEYNSFEAFCEELKSFEIEDKMSANVHSRYTFTREVAYQTKNTKLACSYSPLTEGVKYMTVNGKVVEHVKFEIV